MWREASRYLRQHNEIHRICSKCLDNKGKRKKGSPEGPGSGQSTSKRSKTTGGSEGASRARLTIKQKIEVVRLLDKRISHEEIADRFGCAPQTRVEDDEHGAWEGCPTVLR